MPYRYNANKIYRFLRRRHLLRKAVGWVERKAKPISAFQRRTDVGFRGVYHRAGPGGSPAPTPPALAGRVGWGPPATTYQRGELPRSSYSCEAAAALPRRGASPITLRTRTPPWRATVTTSPHLTSRPGAATRTPLTRTCPTMASDAAALRVRTIRAFHSHRSIRCRSADTIEPLQRRSLAFASSWALRAASLANGEFGSICFSRSRSGA
jgi:hypothetical protein